MVFSVYRKLKKYNFDILILHHIDLLPLTCYLKKKKDFKLVVNIHEYYPKEFDDQNDWYSMGRYWDELCKSFMSYVDLFLSVNESVSKSFIENFNLNPDSFFTFPNIKKFDELSKKNNQGHIINIIHHGAAIPSRKIENMIEMMDYLPDNYVLTLMLLERNPDYLKYLKSIKSSKVKFIEPVDFTMITKTLNNYDIGLYYLTPSNFNEENILPNKFFEFIQARLCLVVSPIIEMKKIVLENQIGLVSNDFTKKDIARQIKSLTRSDILKFKKNSDKCAFDLSIDSFENVIIKEFNKL